VRFLQTRVSILHDRAFVLSGSTSTCVLSGSVNTFGDRDSPGESGGEEYLHYGPSPQTGPPSSISFFLVVYV